MCPEAGLGHVCFACACTLTLTLDHPRVSRERAEAPGLEPRNHTVILSALALAPQFAQHLGKKHLDERNRSVEESRVTSRKQRRIPGNEYQRNQALEIIETQKYCEIT